MSAIIIILNCVLLPLIVAFPKFMREHKAIRPDTSYSTIAMYLKMFSDIWFTLEIMLQFRTGITVESETDVVLNVKRIRHHYLRFWFWLDIMSTVPFDLMIEMSQTQQEGVDLAEGGSYLGLIRLTKIAGLLRLMRLSHLYRHFYLISEQFNFNYDAFVAFSKIAGFTIVLIFWCHLMACVQFLVPNILMGDMGEIRDCWIRLEGLHWDTTPLFSQYSYSFFRALSQMLCIGYGASPPQNLSDMYMILMSMLLGAMLFAIFIGVASSMYHSMDCSKRLYKEKYNSVKQYMHFRKFPLKLRRRITDYYENRYQGKMFNENTVLDELNPILRKAMLVHNCKDLLENVPFFADASDDFVETVIENLKFEMYLTDDEIIKEGTFGQKMYFISRGTVKIHSSGSPHSHSLSDGCFFGEICLLMPNLKRIASVVADNYVYLYSLSVDDFNDNVLAHFPDEQDRMLQIAIERMEGTLTGYNPVDDMNELIKRHGLDTESVTSTPSL